MHTRHAWEDYYITCRAARNLATGNGLTFTVGERIHSFTSPLGVLWPALASLMTGNRSGVAARWIFRAMSIAAYAGAGEPLGYIGYTSNLKMLAYPGLSSAEVVAARRRMPPTGFPACWADLIRYLGPTWLVLRSHEVAAIRQSAPELLDRPYRLARVFDVRSQVAAVPHLEGRGYLLYDAYFEVYHRVRGGEHDTVERRLLAEDFRVRESYAGRPYDEQSELFCHAPSRLVLEVGAGARRLTGGFGFRAGAYADRTRAIDGAEFIVNWREGGVVRPLFRPRDVPANRGLSAADGRAAPRPRRQH